MTFLHASENIARLPNFLPDRGTPRTPIPFVQNFSRGEPYGQLSN